MTERREFWTGIVLMGLSEGLIGLPVYLLAPLLLGTQMSPLLWLVPVPFAAWAGFGLGFFLQGRMRLLYVLGFALIAAGFGIGLWGTGASGGIACVLYGAAMYRGTLATHTFQPDYRALWPALVGYAIAAIVYTKTPSLVSGARTVTISGMATIGLTLFLSNGATLRQATLPGKQRPKLVRSQLLVNRIITTALLGVIFVLSAFSGVSSFIRSRLYAFLVWLFHRQHGATATPTVTPAPLHPSMPQATKHPWAIWIFLEKVLYVIGYGLAIVFLLWALWRIVRLLLKYGEGLFRFLLRKQEALEPDYVDEKTSLGTWASRLASMRQTKKTPSREPRWESLTTNREKIRYLYRTARQQLVRSGQRPDPAWTPWETGSRVKQVGVETNAVDEMIKIYEQVRYSDGEPSDRDVDGLRKALIQTGVPQSRLRK